MIWGWCQVKDQGRWQPLPLLEMHRWTRSFNQKKVCWCWAHFSGGWCILPQNKKHSNSSSGKTHRLRDMASSSDLRWNWKNAPSCRADLDGTWLMENIISYLWTIQRRCNRAQGSFSSWFRQVFFYLIWKPKTVINKNNLIKMIIGRFRNPEGSVVG